MNIIKELLGDIYKEGMTTEEIQKALVDQLTKANESQKELNDLLEKANADIAKLKGIVSDRNSEVAKYKKELQARMSEEELKQQQIEEERKKQEEETQRILKELEDLKRESALSKHYAELIKLGYSEDLAKDTAEALYSGDTARVFKNQQTFVTERENKLKTDLLKEQPTPPAGEGEPAVKKWQDYTMEELNKLAETNPVEYKRVLDSIK